MWKLGGGKLVEACNTPAAAAGLQFRWLETASPHFTQSQDICNSLVGWVKRACERGPTISSSSNWRMGGPRSQARLTHPTKHEAVLREPDTGSSTELGESERRAC